MPITLTHALIGAAKASHALYGGAKSAEAVDALLHAAQTQSATLARIEAGVARLGSAPFLLGLAHLDDANAPGRSRSEAHVFLQAAREAFKEGAQTAADALVRATSALFCAICWTELEYLDDAARWAVTAAEIADRGADEIALRVPPPPAPPVGIWKRISRGLGGGRVENHTPWYTDRYGELQTLLGFIHLAFQFAHDLGFEHLRHRPMMLHPSPGVNGWENPYFLELFTAGEAIPVGTARIAVSRAIWHPWWPSSTDGTLEIEFTVHQEGQFCPDDIGLSTPAGHASWGDSDSRYRKWLAPRRPDKYIGNAFSPGGVWLHIEKHVSDTTTLLFDTSPAPPDELNLISCNGDRRGSWSASFTWERGEPYLESEPEPESVSEPPPHFDARTDMYM